ncbi:hypothetical protein [Lactobacillus xujianguonis]|uniref:hypothetical protein n=1 Tax=Lactobacillus xujianguonis TaxID=2495899 RepID=UPI000FDC7274|nr:hypothetical protein [Lactobacillus xujianguonis]RVU73512.1 hypothetical protein EJK20_07715 [Lactobacillus xujianguonis]
MARVEFTEWQQTLINWIFDHRTTDITGYYRETRCSFGVNEYVWWKSMQCPEIGGKEECLRSLAQDLAELGSLRIVWPADKHHKRGGFYIFTDYCFENGDIELFVDNQFMDYLSDPEGRKYRIKVDKHRREICKCWQ